MLEKRFRLEEHRSELGDSIAPIGSSSYDLYDGVVDALISLTRRTHSGYSIQLRDEEGQLLFWTRLSYPFTRQKEE